MLFVSVYPRQLEQLAHGCRVALLQPPFGFRTLTSQVRALLHDQASTG
jgi:hypothetical protein